MIGLLKAQITKPVFFLDETTTHCWATRVKTFSKFDEPVTLAYQDSRGKSRTIIGAVGGYNEEIDFHFDVVDSTNKEIVVAFLERLMEEIPYDRREVIIVLDNHSSHKSKVAKLWA